MKVDRLVSIIMLLLEKERIGAQELAEMFEVSPRTIYRDIDAINMSGIPVRAISGVGGGFEIMETYKVDRKVFSTSDLSAILMGLSSLSNMMHGNELVNALAKVKSFIPADQVKEIELRANQICIDLSPWIGNRNIEQNMEKMKTALQENRLISFTYTDRHGNSTVRTVEPYQLVMKGRHWYLQGYCYKRDEFRLFKLSRISELQILEEFFLRREYQKPVLEFEDVLSTIQMEIKLRIHKSIMDTMLDYCTYDCFTLDDEEHLIVNFPFIDNEYYYNMLLGFGDKCECLEPLSVREEIKQRISKLAALYDK